MPAYRFLKRKRTGSKAVPHFAKNAKRGYRPGMADVLLSIATLAALALIGGGVVLWRKGGERRKGVTMIVAGLVVLANVAIWSLPPPQTTGQHR